MLFTKPILPLYELDRDFNLNNITAKFYVDLLEIVNSYYAKSFRYVGNFEWLVIFIPTRALLFHFYSFFLCMFTEDRKRFPCR